MPSVSPSTNTDGQDLIPSVIAASTASIVLSGLFFLGRVASRKIKHLSLGASDYVLLYGLLCCWAFGAIDIYLTKIGLGQHLEYVAKKDPSLSQVKLILKLFIVLEVFYDTGLMAIKISILLFYRSIFPGDKFRLATNILMGIVTAWVLGNLLPSIFSCRPINGYWDIDMQPPPICIDKTALYVSGATINILTDVAILVLPVTNVLHLQLNRKSKFAVILLFLLGGLVCVVSIYRFVVLFRAKSPDITYEFAGIVNWSVAELATAVASASLPTMRPLIRVLIPRALSTTRGRNTGGLTDGISRRTELPGSKFERLPEQSRTYVESYPDADLEDGLGKSNTSGQIMITKGFKLTTFDRNPSPISQS
ncbi:hypothetical protein ACMFMG_007843 [Clarireedia jacksonii]